MNAIIILFTESITFFVSESPFIFVDWCIGFRLFSVSVVHTFSNEKGAGGLFKKRESSVRDFHLSDCIFDTESIFHVNIFVKWETKKLLLNNQKPT